MDLRKLLHAVDLQNPPPAVKPETESVVLGLVKQGLQLNAQVQQDATRAERTRESD